MMSDCFTSPALDETSVSPPPFPHAANPRIYTESAAGIIIYLTSE